MNVILLEPKVKAKAPNSALLKFARLCEQRGHTYRYHRGCLPAGFDPDIIFLSCTFSFYSKAYERTIRWYRKLYPKAEIHVGGVFPTVMPSWFERGCWPNVRVHRGLYQELEGVVPKFDCLIHHEEPTKLQGYTQDRPRFHLSRGCTNSCSFCAVPQVEPEFACDTTARPVLDAIRRERPEVKSLVLYDNNFTAHEHFFDIVAELREFGKPVEFNQGLQAALLTPEKAEVLAELQWAAPSDRGTVYVRFAFDHASSAAVVERALGYVIDAGIDANFFCYMLYNWQDTPDDFWQRIQAAQGMAERMGKTVYLFPQRYEPLDALQRGKYVGPNWTKEQVKGVQRLHTFLHGFLPCTASCNLFNWIGDSEQAFWRHVDAFASDRTYRLAKRDKEESHV